MGEDQEAGFSLSRWPNKWVKTNISRIHSCHGLIYRGRVTLNIMDTVNLDGSGQPVIKLFPTLAVFRFVVIAARFYIHPGWRFNPNVYIFGKTVYQPETFGK